MKAKDWFLEFGRGAALGTGILPGVSVGTVGIIVNVYDRLIEAISSLRKDFKRSFLTLLPIALGCIVSAVALLVFWKKLAYVYFPFIVIGALAGFVVGGLPVITKELRGEKLGFADFGRILMGFLLAASIGVLSFLSTAGILKINLDFQAAFNAPFQSWWIFFVVLFVGFLAAVACLIPGISGSMVLFIFGLYNPVVNLFMNQYDVDGNIVNESIFHDKSKLGGGLLIILVLLIGILVGLLAVSKAMKSLLENRRRGTFGVVLGFVLGSLVSMFVNNDMYGVYVNPHTNQWWQFAAGAALFIGVAALTFFAIKKADKRALISETK